MLEGTKPVSMPMLRGERQRAERTKKLLERDVYKLTRELAQRKSPEGQEATRAVILSKRAKIHRINSYIKNTTPYRPIPRERPKRRAIPPQRRGPPKGSELLKARMQKARESMRRRPVSPPTPMKPTFVIKPSPTVVDVRTAQQAADVQQQNQKAMHEAKMKADNDARQFKEMMERKPKVKEIPKAPSLTPLEQRELSSLPMKIKQGNSILGTITKYVKIINSSRRVRGALKVYEQTKSNRAKEYLARHGVLDMNIALGMTLTKDNKYTHPALASLSQKIQSAKNRFTFLKDKQAGRVSRPSDAPKQKPRQSSQYMRRKAEEGARDLARQVSQASREKRMKSFTQPLSGGHPHRPYAMDPNLGALTVLKHRQAQRLHRPAVEPNNMASLRRYTAAQYARDQRERTARESTKEVANLAGAFTHTRAVMERLVR